MPRQRTLDPKEYLAWLREMWNPKVAAEALGCPVAEIRALQTSRKFVEIFLRETVQYTGPEAFRDIEKSAVELIRENKEHSYWELRGIGDDPNVQPAVRTRVHTYLFEKALVDEGLAQKVNVQHEHVVKIDAESAMALEAARAESQRLIQAPIDITPDGVA